MKNTPNYSLPQFEVDDNFSISDFNEAFNTIDTSISDLQETFNINGTQGDLIANEVIQARKGENNLKTKIDKIDKTLIDVSSSLDDNVQQYDYNQPNAGLAKAHQMILNAYNGTQKTQYFMVGDSIRNANGKHIFNIVQTKLERLGVSCTLRGNSGLAARHWGEKEVVGINDEKASQLIPLIDGDGSNTIIDISLGLNDNGLTFDYLAECIMNGINIIKASKPNCTFILTSPHKAGHEVNHIDYRKNIKLAYEKMIKDNLGNIGYINVHDNVFPIYNNQIGYQYMNDLLHPNEIGQRKIGQFIISKLAPNYLEEKLLLLQGGLNPSDVNYNLLKDSGFRIEYKHINGTKPTKLYLKYYAPFLRWYLCNSLSGLSNISSDLKIENGIQYVTKDSGSEVEFLAKVEIKNADVLKKITTNFSIELINFDVVDFSGVKEKNTVIGDISSKDIGAYKFMTYNGELNPLDTNYNLFKDTGFQINLLQTKGNKMNKLHLKYYFSYKKWYLFAGDNAEYYISTEIFANNGSQDIRQATNASINGDLIEFNAQILIGNANILNDIKASATGDVYINLINYHVETLSDNLTIESHIKKIYKLLNTQ